MAKKQKKSKKNESDDEDEDEDDADKKDKKGDEKPPVNESVDMRVFRGMVR